MRRHGITSQHVTYKLSFVKSCYEIQSLCQTFVNCSNEIYILINNIRQVSG